MKEIFTLTVCICACFWASAQKNSSERISYNLYYLPEKLIYDEIKTYSYSIIFDGERNPFSPDEIRKKTLTFEAFKEVEKGDMEIRYRFGPFTFKDRKLETVKRTREVNGKKEEYTTYQYLYTASYPITMSITNTKNGYVMFQSVTGNNLKEPNIVITSASLESERALADYWKNRQNAEIGEFMANLVDKYILAVNEAVRNRFDFFKIKEHRYFFSLKKVDIADKFNDQVKIITKTVSDITANEPLERAKERLAPQIAYLEGLKDKYKATDKKEDVLFFSVNYNLASLYYCLDDMDNAEYYIKRLDEVKEDRSYRNDLSRHIEIGKERMNKHMLDTRHLDYNPVSDFRIADKKYKSDAIGNAEYDARGMLDGTTTATDYIVLYDGTQINGKVTFSENDGTYIFYSETDPDKPVTLNPAKHREFISGENMYRAAKYRDSRDVLALQFALVLYKSKRIMLLEKITDKYVPRESLYMFLKLNDEEDDKPMEFFRQSMKKDISKYLGDCILIPEKVKDGDYGTIMWVTLDKLKQLCQDYTDCKN